MVRSRRTWKTIDELPEIDWENESLASLRTDKWTCVRRVIAGGFAVLALDGRYVKVVKVLPTLDQARAYQFAMHR